MYFKGLAKHYGFSLDVPVKDLPKDVYNMLLYGNNGEKIKIEYDTRTFSGSYESAWEGLIPNLERRYRETTSDYTKSEIERYMNVLPCTKCGGKRLKKEALAVKIGGKNISEFTEMGVEKLKEFIESLDFDKTKTGELRLSCFLYSGRIFGEESHETGNEQAEGDLLDISMEDDEILEKNY
mgnify:CR=1 FL=1